MTYDKCKGGGIKRDSRSESFAVAVVQFVYPETEKKYFPAGKLSSLLA
jgi:hypothetical protein